MSIRDNDLAPSVRGTRWSRPKVAAVALAAASLVALPITSAAAAVKPHVVTPSKTVKPDYAFFKGQTIHYLVSNAPGTSAAEEIVNTLPELESYLGANIEVTYDTAPQNVGYDIVASEQPNGLYLGGMDVTSAAINPEFNAPETFNPAKVSFVGGTADQIHGIVACKNSPITSATQLIKGGVPVKWPAVVPGESYLSGIMFLKAYNIPTTILPGFTGATAFPSCLAGNVSNFQTSLVTQFVSSAGNSLVPGITPLLLSADFSPAEPEHFLNKSTLTIAQFGAKHPPKTKNEKVALNLSISILSATHPNDVMFGPAGIPKARLLALSDALSKALRQPDVIAKFNVDAIPPRFFGADAIVSKIKTIQGDVKLIKNVTGF